MERQGLDELAQRGPRSRATSAARRSPTRWRASAPAARHAAARPGRPGARAAGVRVHVQRGAREVRRADGQAPPAAHAELLQPDGRGHVRRQPRADAAHEGHVQRAQPHAREAGGGRGDRPDLRAVHAAVRRLLPRQPADPRRAARADGRADGGHAGDAQLDDARAAGPAPGAGRAAARGHGPALAGRPARRQPAQAPSRRRAGTGATTSAARTRSASPRPRR